MNAKASSELRQADGSNLRNGGRLEDEAERRRVEVVSSLEVSGVEFQQLLGSLKEADLHVKGPGSVWSVREVAVHVISSIEHTPTLIGRLRRGNDYLNLPLPIAEVVKRLYTRWAAHNATREELIRRFDAACPPVLALVDTIRWNEWDQGGYAYGEGHWTVEHALLHQREHVEAHIRQIRQLLGQLS
jgi:hypothetical protein